MLLIIEYLINFWVAINEVCDIVRSTELQKIRPVEKNPFKLQTKSNGKRYKRSAN